MVWSVRSSNTPRTSCCSRLERLRERTMAVHALFLKTLAPFVVAALPPRPAGRPSPRVATGFLFNRRAEQPRYSNCCARIISVVHPVPCLAREKSTSRMASAAKSLGRKQCALLLISVPGVNAYLVSSSCFPACIGSTWRCPRRRDPANGWRSWRCPGARGGSRSSIGSVNGRNTLFDYPRTALP